MSTCAPACRTCWPPPPTCCTPPASRTAPPMAKAPPISKRCASGTGRRSIARPSAISPTSWWGGDLLMGVYFPGLGHLLDPARQHGPISGGPQALQQVHEARVVADQNPRLVLLDATNNAQRGGGGRGLCRGVEALDQLRAALIVGDAGAGAGVAHDIGGDAAGMHHGKPNWACRHLQLVPQTFGKAAHREFRRGIGSLPRRRDDAEDA